MFAQIEKKKTMWRSDGEVGVKGGVCVCAHACTSWHTCGLTLYRGSWTVALLARSYVRQLTQAAVFSLPSSFIICFISFFFFLPRSHPPPHAPLPSLPGDFRSNCMVSAGAYVKWKVSGIVSIKPPLWNICIAHFPRFPSSPWYRGVGEGMGEGVPNGTCHFGALHHVCWGTGCCSALV